MTPGSLHWTHHMRSQARHPRPIFIETSQSHLSCMKDTRASTLNMIMMKWSELETFTLQECSEGPTRHCLKQMS